MSSALGNANKHLHYTKEETSSSYGQLSFHLGKTKCLIVVSMPHQENTN